VEQQRGECFCNYLGLGGTVTRWVFLQLFRHRSQLSLSRVCKP